MVRTFQEICAVSFDDGVVFDVEGIQIDRIREELEYGGLRIKTNATVDTARVRVLIDIGFGDAVEPGLAEMDLPVMLDFPAPHLRAYARETVIAEKFQAMVMLGRANSRMKDFYDIWVLSRVSEFTEPALLPRRLPGEIPKFPRSRQRLVMGLSRTQQAPDGNRVELYRFQPRAEVAPAHP
jgi:hypothetical protein